MALERPVARVLAVVARQLVRARELPAAAVPVAVVGLLACREGARAGLSFLPWDSPARLWPWCVDAHSDSDYSNACSSLRRSPLHFEPLRILGKCPSLADLLILVPGDPKSAQSTPYCLEPRPQRGSKPAYSPQHSKSLPKVPKCTLPPQSP